MSTVRSLSINDSGRRALVVLACLAALLLSAIGMGAPAKADTWAQGGTVIVAVQTGNKNSSNHTQYVGGINVQTNTQANNSNGCGTFEAWTQNYYQKTERCGSAGFTIGQWVGTNNYVCGAFTDIDRRWARSIACIKISA